MRREQFAHFPARRTTTFGGYIAATIRPLFANLYSGSMCLFMLVAYVIAVTFMQ